MGWGSIPGQGSEILQAMVCGQNTHTHTHTHKKPITEPREDKFPQYIQEPVIYFSQHEPPPPQKSLTCKNYEITCDSRGVEN